MIGSLRRSAQLPLVAARLSTLRTTQQRVNESVQEVVRTIRGTVLDVMAKSMPERDRQWLAEKYDFAARAVEALTSIDLESHNRWHSHVGGDF